MIEESMIRKWKKMYGRVFRCVIQDDVWYYRALRLGEVRTVSMCEDQEQKELMILKCGIIHPKIEDLEGITAGAADRLVLLISGVTGADEESILKRVSDERDKLGISDDYLKWKVQIIKTLNYNPDEVDRMTMDDFVRAIVLTEEVQGRPLVSVGKDDGTTAQPVEEEEEGELENVDTSTAANISERRLRARYVAEKQKKRNRIGRNSR